VKVKLLFLIKLLSISLVLFVFLEWIEKGYKFVLLLLCSILLPASQVTVSLDYASYSQIIPFLALMLATPKITITRKAVFILTGMTIYISIDMASILAWGSFPHSKSTIAHLICSQIWKITGQWILPPLLWFMAIDKDTDKLFWQSEKETTGKNL
jgi:hypothetical protein